MALWTPLGNAIIDTGIILSAVATLFATLTVMGRYIAVEHAKRIDGIESAAAKREEAMGKTLGEMEKFNRESLHALIRSNQDAMHAISEALNQNTRVVESSIAQHRELTTKLQKEIHELRIAIEGKAHAHSATKSHDQRKRDS